ncbi:TetR/AcrR family transcriptional regulator [Nocardiopsis akebiae]|uniref:TetR/AcrR family transcriptional regulator n=1 Tax=Nocardiopsis akebiae TaxID=2831968 RepID=A0ABX8C4I8_9ACTN|nr:TetR/AcrR family transcriptional regulator [Nocardiopsis akebiae]QUX29223.1 TetR/AcrR family transcriptional regulator [Nocardiopsis akebiae]
MAENTAQEEPRVRRGPDPRRRSERARRAIVDAAAELMGEVGYAGLTMEAIAARARVGKQTIYRWWPSKAAVVLDVFTALTGGVAGEPLPDTGDLAEDMRTVLRATADEFRIPEMDRTTRAFTAEIQHDPVFAEIVQERLMGPNARVFEDRLRSAVAAGEVDPEIDLRLATELFLGPFHQRWLLRTGPLTHEYVDELVDVVLRALRPRE